jgi:hypothetical protein
MDGLATATGTSPVFSDPTNSNDAWYRQWHLVRSSSSGGRGFGSTICVFESLLFCLFVPGPSF